MIYKVFSYISKENQARLEGELFKTGGKMTCLQDLPDELLFLIFKELDYFSLYNLSLAFENFQKFYLDSQIVKRIYVDTYNSIIKPWPTLKSYLNKAKATLTHLNLSNVHWVKKSDLFNMLKVMTSLEYLNIIGTDIPLTQIEDTVNKLKKLRSVAVTFYENTDIHLNDSLDLDELHVVLEMNKLRQFLWSTQTLKCMRQIDVKLEVINCPHFTSTLLKILPAIYSTVIFKTVYIKDIPMLKCEVEDILLLVDTTLYKHVVIETSLGIFLSDDVCPDLVDNIFIKRISSNECNTQTYLMNLFGVSVNCQDITKLERFVRKRLNIRMKKMAMAPDTGCFLSKTEPVTQHLIKSTTYQQLIFTPLHFWIKRDTSNDGPSFIKKLKMSQESKPPETTIFRDIISSNKGIVSLNVHQHKNLASSMCYGMAICCGNSHGHMGRIEYNMDSLHSIATLKNLRHLSLTAFPNNCHEFAKQIFMNCQQLKSLQVGSPKFHRIEAIAEHIHYSTSIQIIYLRTCMRQIDIILENLSKAPTLHTIAIKDDKNITRQSHSISLPCLLDLVYKCCKLTFLNIYQEVMPAYVKTQYKRFEKAVQYNSKTIVVNLTEPFAFNLYEEEHYNVNFPTANTNSIDELRFSALQ